jgi:hypothetical protein
MMKWLILVPMMLWTNQLFAQSIVFDPQHYLAVMENQAARASAESAHNQYLEKISSDLKEISANIGTVVLAQTIIYNALGDVNSALKNGLAVKNMAVIIRDMRGYLSQVLKLAKAEPYLLSFASGMEKEMTRRSADLLGDVWGYVLREGGNVLADYNSRDQLLRGVTQQLQILDSLAYGAWKAMFWAKERGLVAAANPFGAWRSKDKQLAGEIIQKSTYRWQ